MQLIILLLILCPQNFRPEAADNEECSSSIVEMAKEWENTSFIINESK